MAALQARSAFKLRTIQQVSPDLAVASIEIGPVTIGSVWVSDCSTTHPRVAWPRSARGYPIITVTDEAMRRAIEAELLEIIDRWRRERTGEEVK